MRTARRPRFFSLAYLALLALPLMTGFGCGNDKPETGTTSEPAVGLDESNNAMEEFMKKQGGAEGQTP